MLIKDGTRRDGGYFKAGTANGMKAFRKTRSGQSTLEQNRMMRGEMLGEKEILVLNDV
jgi:hypothetical protein